MKPNRIRLTESQLRKVIKESVNKVLNEIYADRSKEGIARAINARNKKTIAPLRKKYLKSHDPETKSFYDNEYRNQIIKTKNQAEHLSDMYNEANPDNLNTYNFNPRYGESNEFDKPYNYRNVNRPN